MASRSIFSATLRLRATSALGSSSAVPRAAAPAAFITPPRSSPTTPASAAWSTRSYAAARPKKGKPSAAASDAADGASASSTSDAPSTSSSPSQSSQPESPTEAQAAATAAAESAAAESAAESTPPPRPRSSAAFDIDTTLTAIADGAGEGEGGDAKSGRTGARARSSAEQSSLDKSRRNTRRILLLLGASAVGIAVGNMAREWDTVEERDRFAGNPEGDSAFGRIKLRLKAQWEDFNAPVFDKLLPDLLPFPYQRPYTLCLDLDDLLVHSHWTREHGWRTAKRPGLDYFLGYLGQFYEIVLFTTQPYYLAAPIIEKLDPDRRFFTYTLFRESCRTVDGKVVKDLSALNRDLSRVILLDTEAERSSLQPENALVLRKWSGERGDTELVDALPFLEAIGIYNIPDVRTPIKHYQGTHVPTEYNRRQAEIKAAQLKEWQESRAHSGGGAGRSWFSGFKGGAAAPASASEAGGPPKTWYDAERERYLAAYLEDVKYWQENGEAIRQQAKEEQEKQMKEMKLSAWGMLTGQGLQPPGMEAQQQQQQQGQQGQQQQK